MKLQGKIIINCKLETATGLAIGAGKEALEIGGLDNLVIKNPQGVPYIPGSSIKGKLRSLLERKSFDLTPLKEYRDEETKLKDAPNKDEQLKGKRKQLKEVHHWHYIGGSFIHICPDRGCKVCTTFGRPSEEVISEPTRLYVRDASLDVEHFRKTLPELVENSLFTEAKFENAIDRLTSAANPRNFERVPAGAQFDCEFIFNIFDFENDDKDCFKTFIETLRWLEDDYLGSSGSRGYGKVKVKDLEVRVKNAEDYEKGTVTSVERVKDLEDLTEKLDQILKKLEVSDESSYSGT